MKKIKRIVLILAVIFFVAGIPFLINTFCKINTKYGFWDIEWTPGDMLNYYGAILSGAITFIGGWLTLKYERRKEKKEEIIKYRPILEFIGQNQGTNCGYVEVGLGYPISYSVDRRDKEYIQKKYSENQCGQRPAYQLYFQNHG